MPLRNLLVLLLVVFFIVVAFTFCRYITAAPQTTQIPTLTLETPIATVAPVTIVAPTGAAPTLALATPIVPVQMPVENSEWYLDGWVEDGVVVNMYGREIRFDLAELRNSQTNAAIVVQCIDPEARSPDLNFTLPIEQRDRFIYKGNLFWHTTDPSIQRFIFLRQGEL